MRTGNPNLHVSEEIYNVDHIWLNERAILTGKNTDVNELSFEIQNEIVGELKTYVNFVTDQDDIVNYSTEFLN